MLNDKKLWLNSQTLLQEDVEQKHTGTAAFWDFIFSWSLIGGVLSAGRFPIGYCFLGEFGLSLFSSVSFFFIFLFFICFLPLSFFIISYSFFVSLSMSSNSFFFPSFILSFFPFLVMCQFFLLSFKLMFNLFSVTVHISTNTKLYQCSFYQLFFIYSYFHGLFSFLPYSPRPSPWLMLHPVLSLTTSWLIRLILWSCLFSANHFHNH